MRRSDSCRWRMAANSRILGALLSQWRPSKKSTIWRMRNYNCQIKMLNSRKRLDICIKWRETSKKPWISPNQIQIKSICSSRDKLRNYDTWSERSMRCKHRRTKWARRYLCYMKRTLSSNCNLRSLRIRPRVRQVLTNWWHLTQTLLMSWKVWLVFKNRS